jgi:hypothetical protein
MGKLSKYIGNSIRYSVLINIPFCDLGKKKDIFCEYFWWGMDISEVKKS